MYLMDDTLKMIVESHPSTTLHDCRDYCQVSRVRRLWNWISAVACAERAGQLSASKEALSVLDWASLAGHWQTNLTQSLLSNVIMSCHAFQQDSFRDSSQWLHIHHQAIGCFRTDLDLVIFDLAAQSCLTNLEVSAVIRCQQADINVMRNSLL